MAGRVATEEPEPDGDTAGRRTTRRRAETRRRLIDAALVVFAEHGFGRSTVDMVCSRAGYTRGAFYSNFTSLDELFLAMWEQHSHELLAGVRSAFEQVGEAGDIRTVADVVKSLLPAIPVDETWYRVKSEFIVHALRSEGLRRIVQDREEAIAEAVIPFVDGLLRRTGRTIPDRKAMSKAILAVHDGTTLQCVEEPDNPLVWQHRETLFIHVVTAYSTQIEEKG